jgi:hypothetical protein
MKPATKNAAGRHRGSVIKSGDVVPIRDYVRIDRRNIPIIRFDLPKSVHIVAYGSHMETTPQRKASVLVYKQKEIAVDVQIELGKRIDPAVFLCCGLPLKSRWSVVVDARNALQGSIRQGALQGRIDDSDAMCLLVAVNEILSTTQETKRAYFPHQGKWQDVRIGIEILDVLTKAIRSGDMSRISLLEKVVLAARKASRIPRQVGADVIPPICSAVQMAATKHDRVPSAPEVFDVLVRKLGGNPEEKIFYRDLAKAGFGWLVRPRRK